VPLPPVSWASGVLVSPTNLNTSLYSWNNANPFYPTGIQFHARKPLYKAVGGSASVDSNTFGFVFNAGGPAVIEDSCADYGNLMDPPYWGTIQCTLPGADGQDLTENPSGGGGWFLISAFEPIGNASANGITNFAVLAVSGTAPAWGGQNTVSADGQSSTPWVIDLLNLADAATVTPEVGNGDTTTKHTITTGVGDGITVRYQAQWASVIASGSVLPGAYPPAPKTNWSADDAWTSAWANGPAGIGDVLAYLNQPPCLRADSGGGDTSLANGTTTQIALTATQLDPWSGFDTDTWEYTIPADGLYLVHVRVGAHTANANFMACAIINGDNWYGPANPCNGSVDATATKTQIFSLKAGDTVGMGCYQDSGAAVDTSSADRCRLVIVWLGSQGSTGPLATNGYFSASSDAGWQATGGALAAQPQVVSGAPYPFSALLTPSGAGTAATALDNGTPFTAGTTTLYAMSAWVNPAGTATVTYGFDWLNGSGGTFSTSVASQTVAGGGTLPWTLVHTMQLSPGTATASAYPRVGMSQAGTIPSSLTLGIAGVQAGECGGVQPTAPDLTYKYTAGTAAGTVASVFSEHLGNDLSFLVWRPYLLAYQSDSQSVPNATSTKVTMDTVAGQPHADFGDNYGGWDSALDVYVAKVPGWYLVCAEVTVGVNTSASWPECACQIQVSTGPDNDAYENHVIGTASDGTTPGATALGCYYLREGDYVWPLIYFTEYPENGNTVVTTGHASHFEAVWCSS
jgi:hypothetical protein